MTLPDQARTTHLGWTGALLATVLAGLVLSFTDSSAGTAAGVGLLVLATALVVVAGVRTARYGTPSRLFAGVTVLLVVLRWLDVLL